MNQLLDVVIIGAGPIGLACGIEAKKNGLSYLILEKGCLVNSLYNYPMNMTFFSTSEKLEIGGVPFISHNNKPTRAEALEYYRRVTTSWDLKVNLYEGVSKVKKEGHFEITTEKNQYVAKNLIIATGFYDLPFLLNVPGENLPKVKHYYDEPHPYFGQKIIVVGAANSAVDVALETYRKGADVTMVVREPEINPRVKYWVRPDIENRIKESSIKAYFNSSIAEIKKTEVTIDTPNGKVNLENDFVLAMTGYQPSFTFLKSLGITIGSDDMQTPAHNPETMETNVAGIFLAGVVCGGLQTNKWFIENSRVHAEMITKKILQSDA
ncbi:YpdA family putative bacillithiol disulfide reductase [Reichenbachiella carrageenanivorans]|uniref:YpdA family putative bacillithiol disulfide reductase n=1 Tax=Reichenbachiella carrageenanivorans TaxID=2979869 RepID=A0ABY6D6G0_9BACT|nr:YpdA family putative bacillithiol disulfide reductase [Reichenbachiella carrageenanivorans]UXX80733.1 YpdA family putative bacillithiol disulfide reductase [Reichenbachiella carrageenanivorans]